MNAFKNPVWWGDLGNAAYWATFGPTVRDGIVAAAEPVFAGARLNPKLGRLFRGIGSGETFEQALVAGVGSASEDAVGFSTDLFTVSATALGVGEGAAEGWMAIRPRVVGNRVGLFGLRGEPVSSYRSLMSKAEAARYDLYWDRVRIGQGQYDEIPTVAAYRSQPRELLLVDPESGNVTLVRPQGRGRQGVTIHIGFDRERAQWWLTERPSTKAQVVTFEVPRSFLERLRYSYVSEQVFHDRLTPWRVDLDFPDQYAIPPGMFDEFENSIIPGSGRILLGPEDFLEH